MAAYSNSSGESTKAKDKDFSLREGLSEIRKDASAVKDDLDSLRTDATQMATHATQEAIEAVRHGAQSAGEMAKSVGESAKQCHTALTEKVSQRPTASVLLALGTGVIIGRIIAARR